jgi:hypothetical protein
MRCSSDDGRKNNMRTTRTNVFGALEDNFLTSSSLALEIGKVAHEMGDTLSDIDRLIRITRKAA